MKEIKLTIMQRDALLFKALIREVFPKPKKRQMYFTPQLTSQKQKKGKYIYLNTEYYNILFDSIKKAETAGNFRSSNAEEHWLGIISSFTIANDVHDINLNKLQEWEF